MSDAGFSIIKELVREHRKATGNVGVCTIILTENDGIEHWTVGIGESTVFQGTEPEVNQQMCNLSLKKEIENENIKAGNSGDIQSTAKIAQNNMEAARAYCCGGSDAVGCAFCD